MKANSSQKTLKRNAKTTAAPYAYESMLDSKARQKIKDDFLKGIDGTVQGVYLARK
jgi:hypothetical protein